MLVITGNPGVGKHTIAKIIAKRLSMRLVDISSIAIENNAVISKDSDGYVVDLRKLASVMRQYVGKKNIVVGHLAPYVLHRGDVTMAAVIRRSPYELKKVYRKRKYSATKAADNVASEIIGVCLYDSMRKFGRKKVAEFDSTATEPEKTAEKIIDTFRRRRELSVGKVDWLSLIVANSDMKEFFEYRKVRC